MYSHLISDESSKKVPKKDYFFFYEKLNDPFKKKKNINDSNIL